MKSSPRRRNPIIKTVVGLFVAIVAAGILSLCLLSGPAMAVTNNSEELAFVGLINQYRQSQGLQPLLLSDALSDSSQKHSSDMGKYRFFDHYTTGGSDFFPVGSSPWARMAACGYSYNTYMGENIAAGYGDASSVFVGWKNSSGHNANMLGANFKVIGVGMVYVSGSQYGYYWTTDFGGYVDPTAHSVTGSSPPPPPPPPPPPADTTNPVVSFVTPGSGVTVSGIVPIQISATDNVGVVRVELYVNGTLGSTDTSAPYSSSWDTSGITPGSYSLQARAYDAVGNIATDTIYVGVASVTSTTAPVTTTTLPPEPTTTTTTPPVTTSTTSTTSAPPVTTSTTVPRRSGFSDVNASTLYGAAIVDLAGRGVISGYSDGSFGPDNGVTRQQFAKMIVLALGYPLPTSASCAFEDIQRYLDASDLLYPYTYIAVATEHGITEGKTPYTFDPYSGVTRAQLATMVARAADLAEPPSSYSPPFGNFSADHYPWARSAAFAGLFSGLQGVGPTYNFWTPATRGEVSQMLYNLLHR